MESASAFFQNHASSWNYSALKNFHSISQPVKSHLRQVYWNVATTLVAAAIGVYAHMLLNIGGLLTSLGFIAMVFWLLSTPPSYSNQGKRWKLLMSAGLFQGASVGLFIELALQIDPSIIVTAFLATVAVFASFSGAALLAKRREYMFLGGILASATSTMLTLHFLSLLFGGAAMMFKLELYLGLLIFVGYVLFDTQLIIEKAEKGDFDDIGHALLLFIDFVAIFVRILAMLTRKAAEKEREEKRRERRRESSRY